MTGNSSGTRISTEGTRSMTMPTRNTRIMMTSISSRGRSTSGASASASCWGSCATVISQAATMAAPTRNITIAVDRPAEISVWTSIRQVISR